MQQGPFAPRALPRFLATTDPAATVSPSAYFPLFAVSSRAQARTTLGGEFPTSSLSIEERVPSSAIAHVSCAPSKIPDIGFSPVRLQERVIQIKPSKKQFRPLSPAPTYRSSLSYLPNP